ncbi:Hsp70 family protein [Waterburya agarophytonicola K14]|uniref:Hsp70 family protein n=1 Tax=Waterburya agarophytonicola KI4 TaxID=2874699 RepID=A0A964BP96_9CYAN|nr:Hsp70 family protein [Waterburya agarophytonicola]MCC0177078.1 Hsp70 family protein [Waterburya agarophytonicola KI4]
MGKIVGIDLGTTNSVAAFKFVNTEIVTAPDNSPPDRKLTRSVVAAKGESLIVGNDAYFQLKADTENAIVSIKRLIGRGFADAVVQQQLNRFGYKVSQSTQGTENSLSVWLGGKEYEPEDISAKILAKLVQNAQTYQETYQEQSAPKERITEAVITIPAYFNDKQRKATQIAANRAGLENSELLPEPTAAAISYGFKPNCDDVKTILVYDFGGGTFDSSIVTSVGDRFIESGKAGDLWLGGDDLDDLMIDFIKQQVAEIEDLEDIDFVIAQMPHHQRVRFLGELKVAVEQAKIDLSDDLKTRIRISTPLLDDLGIPMQLIDLEITRQQFEAIIEPLVERSIAVCQDTIEYSDYPEDMIDAVLLVGGSSQIPLVQNKVREVFGADKVVIHPRPMYAVAEGAAIVAAGLIEKVSTVSRDYCVELADNCQYTIVKIGDILPVRTTHTFKIEADGQGLIHFKFYSPDRVNQRNRERIGDMWLALEQYYSKGTEILFIAELDEKNSSLQTTAFLKNDPTVKVSCSLSTGGEDESIARQVEQIIERLNQDGNLTQHGVKEAYRIAGETVKAANQIKSPDGKIQGDRVTVAKEKYQELKRFADDDYDTAEFYVGCLRFIAGECGFLLDLDLRSRLSSLCRDLENAIANHRKGEMQKLGEDTRRELNNLPEKIGLILACRNGVARAHQIAPHESKVLVAKLSQMMEAIKQEDSYAADRMFGELARDIEPYLDRDLSSANNIIVTGLTK